MGKRYVTFQEISGNNFRLLTPQGPRDFEGGVLATDDEDPALPFIEAWAGSKPNIKIEESGEVVKAAVLACPVCGQQVESDAALEEHNETAHVQPESKGQKTTRRKK